VDFLEFRCITGSFQCCVSRLSFYRQILSQLIVASLSHPTVFLQCYSLLLLYFGQIIDDDDDGDVTE